MSLLNHTKNYIITYDLNGPVPTHAQVDKHLATLGVEYGRVLETVWYLRSFYTLDALFNEFDRILSANDRVLVVEASNAWMRNLLVPIPAIQKAWMLAA